MVELKILTFLAAIIFPFHIFFVSLFHGKNIGYVQTFLNFQFFESPHFANTFSVSCNCSTIQRIIYRFIFYILTTLKTNMKYYFLTNIILILLQLIIFVVGSYYIPLDSQLSSKWYVNIDWKPFIIPFLAIVGISLIVGVFKFIDLKFWNRTLICFIFFNFLFFIILSYEAYDIYRTNTTPPIFSH